MKIFQSGLYADVVMARLVRDIHNEKDPFDPDTDTDTETDLSERYSENRYKPGDDRWFFKFHLFLCAPASLREKVVFEKSMNPDQAFIRSADTYFELTKGCWNRSEKSPRW